MARPKQQRDDEDARAKRDLRCSVSRIAFLAGVSAQSVTNARAEGAPRNKDGTMAWPAVRSWAQANGRLGYAKPGPTPPPIGTPEDYDTAIKRLKAAAAQRDHDQAMGHLVAKVEIEREVLRYVLAVRAAILALPQQLGMALANLPAREVETILRERLTWLCQQHQEGIVTVPEHIAAAIAELVEPVAR